MSPLEAARRLGVAENQVSKLEEHPAGHLATLRDGRTMLVTETVARAYVPEVDDPATGGIVTNPPVVGEDGPPPLVNPKEPEPKPEAAPKRRGAKGGSAG